MAAFAVSAFGQLTVGGLNQVSATISYSGAWSIYVPGPNWQFGGNVGSKLSAANINSGADDIGAYQELAFLYSIASSNRSASIRVYANSPAILFSMSCGSGCRNLSPFPAISTYPQIQHLSFNGEFAAPDFTAMHPDSPWVFFDSAANTFILSAASDYMTSSTDRQADGSLTAGISSRIATLPAGFTHRTMLVLGAGINRTFGDWGQALTNLSGKQRPLSDADRLLSHISYWTDNGATYYYNPGGPSYEGTLESIKAEFDAKGIQLGTMQLDSWWYPKGPDNSWSSHSGIWTYRASPALFQPDLQTFQATIGVPLVTHARWIDTNSPYRTQYAMSGNVAIDPQYWEDVASYLQASGVATYEQDWLGDKAQTDFNLSDPAAFLGNMAASMARRGITLQYCMATPAHFLQSTAYDNVTTVRASQDGFSRSNWTNFFYSSRFASAMGLWPFTDVFMSSDADNLIAAVLSAGPVGLGDAAGDLSRGNLLRAVRSDGVIVKPDVAATPLDSVFTNDAMGVDVPMVVSTFSDFGDGLRANYIFAYTRGTNNSVTIDPAAFGISGAAWLYDWKAGTGRLIEARSSNTLNLADDAGYFVLVPIGKSGMALLGDKGHYASLGKKRIPAVSDDGFVDATVSFAAGETERTLFGYSPFPVAVAAVAGSVGRPAWDRTTQMFSVTVMPNAGSSEARVRIGSARQAMRR